MRRSSGSFALALLLLGACDCGSAPTTRGTATTTAVAPPAATATATAPSPAVAADPAPPSPRVVRVLVPSERGTLEHTVDLAAGTLEGCVRASDGSCAPWGRRDGPSFPDAWRATVARLAVASRGATCPTATGPTWRIEIDGASSDVVVPPYPEDRDYFPPEDDVLRECAPIELARTVQTFLSWE